MNQETKVEVPLEEDPRERTTGGVTMGALPVVTDNTQQIGEEADFLEGSKACSLDGEGGCESCQ